MHSVEECSSLKLSSVWVVFAKYRDEGWAEAMVSGKDPRDSEEFARLAREFEKEDLCLRQYDFERAEGVATRTLDPEPRLVEEANEFHPVKQPEKKSKGK